jgi:hypothetical protein
MADLTALREGMEVVGSDGRHVGDIDHVLDQGEIQLNRRDSEAEAESGAGRGHHHFIPVDWVERIDSNANRATLRLSRDEAESRWRHES